MPGLDIITTRIPDIGVGGVISTLTWFILTIVFGIFAGFVVYLLLRNKSYNKKVVVFQKIGGRFEVVANVRAMLMKIGEAGDTVLYVQKFKKYVPTPSIQAGRNIYWFAEREDGEWINFGIEDIDEKSRELNVYFLDKEMRYARAALQKNLKERYQSMTFLEKYGGLMVWTALCLVIIVGVFLWMDKLIEITAAVDSMLKTSDTIINKADGIMATLDNICSGSGAKSV